MKPAPSANAQRTHQASSDAAPEPQILLAHKKKLVVPGGKKETTIVFSRVSHKQLTLDKTGDTKAAAKFAVKLMRENLEKSPKLTPEKIDNLMSKMSLCLGNSKGGYTTNENVLESQFALPMLIKEAKLAGCEIHYTKKHEEIAFTPLPKTPPASSVELPELPDLSDFPEKTREKKYAKADGSYRSNKEVKALDVQTKSGKLRSTEKENSPPKPYPKNSLIPPTRTSVELPELPDLPDE